MDVHRCGSTTCRCHHPRYASPDSSDENEGRLLNCHIDNDHDTRGSRIGSDHRGTVDLHDDGGGGRGGHYVIFLGGSANGQYVAGASPVSRRIPDVGNPEFLVKSRVAGRLLDLDDRWHRDKRDERPGSGD